MIRIKRVFLKRSEEDGYRVLVDRKWPLGIRKEAAALDYWAKELSPTEELRAFYQHDPKRWASFRARFREELKAPAALATLTALARMSKSRPVTLVFGTREEKRNAASVVQDAVESLLLSPLPAAKDSHAHSTKRRDRARLKAFKSLAFAAVLALAAGAARADDGQSTIISAHGDARARATSAEALVQPMPAVPPNSAPPVVPSATVVVTAPTVARPPAVPAPSARAQRAPATLTETNAAPRPAAPTPGPEHGRGRAALIAAGALLAVAMFLWDRRPRP